MKHEPWDRVKYPNGYHEQLNADYRAEARKVLARTLAVLVQAGTGTPEVLQYLAENSEPAGES